MSYGRKWLHTPGEWGSVFEVKPAEQDSSFLLSLSLYQVTHRRTLAPPHCPNHKYTALITNTHTHTHTHTHTRRDHQ
jgi:hypothetical protein